MRIKEETSLLLREKFGLSEAMTLILFDAGLFREDIARRVLIREEYHSRCDREPKTGLKWELADRYAVSVSTVEKILKED
jgi:hypothetical protein